VHRNDDLLGTDRGCPATEDRLMRRTRAAWVRRALILAALFGAVGSPLAVSAAGANLPPIPSLPETPQTDDPTVIVASAEHGPTMGSASCFQFPSSTNCNGTNPMTVECSADAYTVFNTQTPIYDQTNGTLIGYLELRYSPHCATNWARTTFTNPAYINPLYQRDTYVAGAVGRADDPFFNDEPVRYSAEIYAPTTTECAYVKVTEGITLIAQVTGTCA
jgi:hypothetical protein